MKGKPFLLQTFCLIFGLYAVDRCGAGLFGNGSYFNRIGSYAGKEVEKE